MDLHAREHYGVADPAPVRRRRLVSWLVFAIVAMIVALMPSVVAAVVTTEPGDSRWMVRPWDGWSFAVEVIREAPSARAASPGQALELATVEFDDPTALSVELAYVADGEVMELRGLTDSGEADVRIDPPRPLVWQVHGSWEESTARGTIGLLDFASGSLVWDVRDSANGRTEST